MATTQDKQRELNTLCIGMSLAQLKRPCKKRKSEIKKDLL